jgi:tryptophan-rich sensory protein
VSLNQNTYRNHIFISPLLRITPPDIAFPIVWSAAYVGMGVASYRVLQKLPIALQSLDPSLLRGSWWRSILHPSYALPVYGVHLLFNFAWCPLFFQHRRLGWALLDSIAVTTLLAWDTILFYKVCSLINFGFVT